MWLETSDRGEVYKKRQGKSSIWAEIPAKIRLSEDKRLLTMIKILNLYHSSGLSAVGPESHTVMKEAWRMNSGAFSDRFSARFRPVWRAIFVGVLGGLVLASGVEAKTKKLDKDLCGKKVKAVLRPKKKREGTMKDILYYE